MFCFFWCSAKEVKTGKIPSQHLSSLFDQCLCTTSVFCGPFLGGSSLISRGPPMSVAYFVYFKRQSNCWGLGEPQYTLAGRVRQSVAVQLLPRNDAARGEGRAAYPRQEGNTLHASLVCVRGPAVPLQPLPPKAWNILMNLLSFLAHSLKNPEQVGINFSVTLSRDWRSILHS